MDKGGTQTNEPKDKKIDDDRGTNTHRLYVSRKGGRGLFSIEDSVDASIRRLEDYIKMSKERLITAANNSTDNIGVNKTIITRKQKWEEKQLYGYFKQQTDEISHKKTWTWLRKGNFKWETESLLITAQNNTLRTNYIKAKIDNMQQNSKSRLCRDKDEMVNHTL